MGLEQLWRHCTVFSHTVNIILCICVKMKLHIVLDCVTMAKASFHWLDCHTQIDHKSQTNIHMKGDTAYNSNWMLSMKSVTSFRKMCVIFNVSFCDTV